MPREGRPPSLTRNFISSVGLVIALIALVNIAFLIFADFGSDHSNPYLGIFAYVVFPAVLCLGLAIWIFGILRERRRRHRHAPEEISAYPHIDLNNLQTRRIAGWVTIGLTLFLMVSVFGTYKAYHYTESDAFCGTTCHSVMHPEFTAYKASPHARVGCVNCHIGSGATWYAKSKLSGTRQLWRTALNQFPRPIQTPVHDLRPAQETCEQCHWPEKFWGAQLKVFNHFGYDEGNTPRETRLLIKTGGGDPQHGLAVGIHSHMNLQNEVSYLSDEKRQKIDYIKVRNRRTGKITEYFAEDAKITPQQAAVAQLRTMDCVDCHNRPTHIYQPPDYAVDRALLSNDIRRDLPYIKAQAVAALSKDYGTTDQAVATIAKDIDTYYKSTYPAVHQSRKQDIDTSVAALQKIFRTIRFPEMKTDWRTHPNNIGHFYSTGCFRCHDDLHVSKDGQRVTKDCNICHDVLGQKEAGHVMIEATDMQFQHPVDLGDMRQLTCAECHTGAEM